MAPSATMMTSDYPSVVHTTLNYYLDPAHGGHSSYTPGSAGSFRRKFDEQPVQIHDIRGREAEFNLTKQGFQLHKHTSIEKDFRDDEEVKRRVYPETQDLLKKVTGATKVHVFSHIIRRDRRELVDASIAASSLPDSAPTGKIAPAGFAHIDQSHVGALEVLNDNLSPDDAATLQNSRWSIINVWRPIKPIHKDPLAMCDARTCLDEDLVPIAALLPPKGSKTQYADVSAGKRFEILYPKANPDHRWYYASRMTPEEVLLIKCFDSKTDPNLARRVPHSAFTDPKTRGDTTRESIEVRCLVFYEDQPAE